jgi:hypothetical protein
MSALVNVFRGIEKNPLFYGIWIITSILQVLIVQFGSIAFHVSESGLSIRLWALTVGMGLISFPVQQVINILYRWGINYRVHRNKNRHKWNASFSKRSTGSDHQ